MVLSFPSFLDHLSNNYIVNKFDIERIQKAKLPKERSVLSFLNLWTKNKGDYSPQRHELKVRLQDEDISVEFYRDGNNNLPSITASTRPGIEIPYWGIYEQCNEFGERVGEVGRVSFDKGFVFSKVIFFPDDAAKFDDLVSRVVKASKIFSDKLNEEVTSYICEETGRNLRIKKYFQVLTEQ